MGRKGMKLGITIVVMGEQFEWEFTDTLHGSAMLPVALGVRGIANISGSAIGQALGLVLHLHDLLSCSYPPRWQMPQ